MLIENDLSGHNLYCSIIGIGINLNQAVFRGDAPNPVSLFQIIGKEVDREEVLDRFLSVFYRYYLSLLQEEYEDIRIRYQSALYRREGYHAYRDEAGEFEACIHDIESTGHLLLALRDGSIRRYALRRFLIVSDVFEQRRYVLLIYLVPDSFMYYLRKIIYLYTKVRVHYI